MSKKIPTAVKVKEPVKVTIVPPAKPAPAPKKVVKREKARRPIIVIKKDKTTFVVEPKPKRPKVEAGKYYALKQPRSDVFIAKVIAVEAATFDVAIFNNGRPDGLRTLSISGHSAREITRAEAFEFQP